MPVGMTVGKKTYASTNKRHAEEMMFASGLYNGGNFSVDMDAWPCTGEAGHNCHNLFKLRSTGRIITVNCNGDHADFAATHGKAFGSTGTITYNNGAVTYT